jgi:hypothetical protein
VSRREHARVIIPIRIGGRHVGDVVVRPGADDEDRAAIEPLSALAER